MATLQELLAEKARRQASVSPAVISGGVQTATTTGSNPRLEELLAEKARRQTQVVPEENNMFQKLAVNVIGRPAIRASQALIGLGVEAFGNEQQKTNFYNEIKKPVKLPMGLGNVAPQKEFGQGGVKQLALDTGKSALDIATLGAGSAVNMGLRKVGAKVLPRLAKSKLGRMAIGTASNVVEGLGYNTGVNILNEKPLTDNAGVTGIASAVLPPIIKGIVPAAKSIKRGVTGIFSPVNTMERVVGLNKLDYQKFKQTTGKRAGQYLNEIDAYGNIEEITTKLSERGYASKNKVDTGLEMIEGVYKPKQAQNMLAHLVERETSLGVAGKDTNQIAELANKFSAEGLTHKEMNAMKRIYERTVRFGYNKLTSPDVVEKATRIDDAFRQWQFKEASDRGFKDLAALNKETQATRNLLNAIGKKYSGDSNQAIGLGDMVLLSGGNPQAIAMYLGRKAFMDKGVQSSLAKSIYTGVKTGLPKGNVILTSQFPRLPAGTGDSFSPIPMGAPKTPTTYEAPSQKIRMSSSIPEQKLLSAPTSNFQGVPIRLGARSQSTIDAQEIARIQAQRKPILDQMLSPKPPQLLETEKLTKSYTPSKPPIAPKVKLPSNKVTPKPSSAKEAIKAGFTEEPLLGSKSYQRWVEKNAVAFQKGFATGESGFNLGGAIPKSEQLDAKTRSLEIIKKLNNSTNLPKQSPAAKAVKDGLTEEQWIKEQGTPLYHGSRVPLRNEKGLISLADNPNISENYAHGGGGGRKINENPEYFLDGETGKKYTQDLKTRTLIDESGKTLDRLEAEKLIDSGVLDARFADGKVTTYYPQIKNTLDLTSSNIPGEKGTRIAYRRSISDEAKQVIASLKVEGTPLQKNHIQRIKDDALENGMFDWGNTKTEPAVKHWKDSIIKQLEDKGYDSIKFVDEGNITTAVFDPKNLKSTSQLRTEYADELAKSKTKVTLPKNKK